MVKKPESGIRKWLLLGMLPLLPIATGCSLQEAVVDGFFGGISDTVSALVSDAAVGVVSPDKP